ncbi:MAG: hypothetical protein DRP65_06160 [Planctomycetota bacterium]|nr:MAG: hypothetical protein DRP65_06160 [Planctomycetota bacterium]
MLSQSCQPSNRQTIQPSNRPTIQPSNRPTIQPSNRPTVQPTRPGLEPGMRVPKTRVLPITPPGITIENLLFSIDY